MEACPSNALSNIDSPSLFFRIDPTGKIDVLGTFDKLRINDFQTSIEKQIFKSLAVVQKDRFPMLTFNTYVNK